jgi:hypothetical protein
MRISDCFLRAGEVARKVACRGWRQLWEALTSAPPILVSVTTCPHTDLLIRGVCYLEGWHLIVGEPGGRLPSEFPVSAVILLDLDPYGRHWRRELARFTAERTCIVVAHEASDDIVLGALSLGARDVLVKPLSGQSLSEAVRVVRQVEGPRQTEMSR